MLGGERGREKDREIKREGEIKIEREGEIKIDRGRDRERERGRENCPELLFLILKGMTGALALFSYLVLLYCCCWRHSSNREK